MTTKNRVKSVSSPDSDKMDTTFERDVEKDYKIIRDGNLPISERGDAFARIYEVVSYSEEGDNDTRKAALGYVLELSSELGTEKSANTLAKLLFDPSSEIRTMIFAGVSTFIEKTDDENFEAIVYGFVEDLARANELPLSISSVELDALEDGAKQLIRKYPSQYFSALFAPSSVSKGSLKWLAKKYPKLKTEIFSDGSENGARADRSLMSALKSASAQLTDTIDKAMLAMDAMNTVAKTVQSVLGIYSDLLRVSGEPGIVIVSTALTSNVMDQVRSTQPYRPSVSETGVSDYPSHVSYGHHSSISQISPKTNIRRFSSEIEMREAVPLASVKWDKTSSPRGDVPAYNPIFRATPSRPLIPYPSTPTKKHQRSSSAPPTPTFSERIFFETEGTFMDYPSPKRVKKEEDSPKAPSPIHSPQRHDNSPSRGGPEPYRGGGRGRYLGKNFIPNYIPPYKGRSGYRGRESYRPWRGRQSHWGGRGERSENYQDAYRGPEYPSKLSYGRGS